MCLARSWGGSTVDLTGVLKLGRALPVSPLSTSWKPRGRERTRVLRDCETETESETESENKNKSKSKSKSKTESESGLEHTYQ
jgi:hypothetical protein